MKPFGAMLVALALSAGLAHAGEFGLGPGFTQADLDSITQAFGDAVNFPNLGGAAPGGVTGFQILGVAGGPEVDTSAHWWRYVPHANTVGGVLFGQRVIVRKGLPFNLDVGVQVGRVFGDQFWGADVRWAFVEGGALSPAMALRAAYSRASSSLLDRLDVAEAQLVISKDFPVVSPYGAIGYRRVSGRANFGDPVPLGYSSTTSGVTATVGARLGLLPFFHVVGEVRRATSTCVFVGVGVGQ
ncbi:MAG: DUF6588 family protein [Thermoanaerobaculaceae bacterium]|jgi:hypothetical protein